MARFLDALRQLEDGEYRAVWSLLQDELGATLTLDAGERQASWCPREIEHSFLLHDRGDDGRYLLYTALVFEVDDGVSALEIVSLLNRRQLGLTFVSVPLGDAGVIYAYSFTQLSEDSWTNFALFVMLLKRQIGLVEVASRQGWIREHLGLDWNPQPLLDGYESAPLSLVLTPVLDPADPTFATGLWISEAEAQEFHKYMAEQLPSVESRESYSYPSSDVALDLSSDVRLEANYAHSSLTDLSVVRDYDALVKIKQLRHPELGWGVQETQTFAYFTSQEIVSENEGIIGEPEASRLANVLNHISYRNVLAESTTDLPKLAIGSWVAKRDQIFFGTFFPATVLKDLADESVGAFGFALSLALSPRIAIQRAETLIAHLREQQLQTQREPDPFSDNWLGCTDSISHWPVVARYRPDDEEETAYGVDPATPTVISIASWGFFKGTPVVFSLDLIQDPISSAISLIERRRYPTDTRSHLVFGPKTYVIKSELEAIVSAHFRSLQIPRIDWCQIQNPDFEECVRSGLMQFARELSLITNVDDIISEIYQAASPWDLWTGATFPNVFNPEESVESGFAWVVTLPNVVDSAIARLEMIFEHAKFYESGASQIELIGNQTTSEYFLRMRMAEIELFTPYEDFLRNFFDVGEETILALLKLRDPA